MTSEPMCRFKTTVCIITALLLLPAVAQAGKLPGWLEQKQAFSEDADDPKKGVWLVIADSEDKPFEGLSILGVPASISEGNRRKYLYDMVLSFDKKGVAFQFDRKDMASIHFYTRVFFSEYGEPSNYGYRPAVYLRSGDKIRERVEKATPTEALNPKYYRYEKTESVKLYGKQKETHKTITFDRPILAMAWTRNDAEAARDRILRQLPRNAYHRTFIDWGDKASIQAPTGRYTVEVNAGYTVSRKGGYSSWVEETEGTITVTIDNRDHDFEFSDRCNDTINKHHFRSTSFCGSQVRVSKWKNDPSKTFGKFYFTQNGVYLFSRIGPASVATDVRVGFRSEVRP